MDINSGLQDKEKEILQKLFSREIKIRQVGNFLEEKSAAKVRLKFLETELETKFECIKSYTLDPGSCRANIENMVGAVQVPVGVAGPVKVDGEFAAGSFYLPVATTEGTLVASINRGCSVINKSGGAQTIVLKNAQSRSILFKADSVKDVKSFCVWVNDNFDQLKSAGQKDEPFLKIEAVEARVTGLNVWLDLRANTSDAMGMNMITIAGKQIAEYITEKYPKIKFISESGNMCVDKKPSAMNLINGRGKKVIASVDIKDDVIKKMLKTTPDDLVDLNYRKNLLGSAAAGALGYNAHFANIVAAMFIATGQDVAHVVDGSHGFTTVEKIPGCINFSVTITDLQVATVGGGTGLASQKECLSMLGVAGPGKIPGTNSLKLAEIISAGVLAGEISLLAALCSQDLSKAHKALNR